MSLNYDVIVIFLIYGQFGAIREPDSGSIVCKTYIFINSNLISYKNRKQNNNISNTAVTLLPWVKILFLSKNADFLQINADISKINKALELKGVFYETKYECVLTYQILKFLVLFLASFRQGGGVILPPTPLQNRTLKSPPRFGLKIQITIMQKGFAKNLK